MIQEIIHLKPSLIQEKILKLKAAHLTYVF